MYSSRFRRPLDWMPPIARQQRGVFSRAQAIAAGMAPGEADHRIGLGLWHRVAGKGLVRAGQPKDPVVRAWALALTWPEAVLWGPSALQFWLPKVDLPNNLPLYGSVGSGHRPSRGLVAKETLLAPDEVAERFGVKVQVPHAALVDTMMMLNEPERSSLFSWMFTRDKADPVEFIRMVGCRTGRPGAKAMVRYVQMAERGVVCENELRVALLFDRFEITGWQANAQIKLPGLVPFRADFLFAKEKLVVEADGWAFHSSRQAFEDNRWRDAQLQAAGYQVVRLTWNQVVNQPEATAALIRSILANR